MNRRPSASKRPPTDRSHFGAKPEESSVQLGWSLGVPLSRRKAEKNALQAPVTRVTSGDKKRPGTEPELRRAACRLLRDGLHPKSTARGAVFSGLRRTGDARHFAGGELGVASCFSFCEVGKGKGDVAGFVGSGHVIFSGSSRNGGLRSTHQGWHFLPTLNLFSPGNEWSSL